MKKETECALEARLDATQYGEAYKLFLAHTIRAIKTGASLADLKIPETNEPRPVTEEAVEALAHKYVGEFLHAQCSTTEETKALREELRAGEELRDRLADILTATANALHGGPLQVGSWSWHDLAELATLQRVALVACKPLLEESKMNVGMVSMIDTHRLISLVDTALNTGCNRCGDLGKVYDAGGELNAPCPNGCKAEGHNDQPRAQ